MNINEVRRRIQDERLSTIFKLEVGDAEEKATIPFVMTFLAPLSGATKQEDISKRKLETVLSVKDFEELRKNLDPTFKKPIANKLVKDGEDIEVTLKLDKPVGPDEVVRQVDVLNGMQIERDLLSVLKGTAGRDPEKKKAIIAAIQDPEIRKALEERHSGTDAKRAQPHTPEKEGL